MGRSRQLVVAGCCLVLAVTSLTGATAASRLTGRELARPSLRALQLNLCDSGLAGCYTGRSVARAAEVIRAERPDIVTLNEVCRDDVSVLERAMTGRVTSAFTAAADRSTDGPVRCRNGQPYGIGLLARVLASADGHRAFDGVYPMQDADDVEDRVWLCLAAGGFYACTTHLASTSAAVALGQCGYLLNTVIPALRTRPDPVVLGGDLNLGAQAQSCLPPGYQRVDDGARQHIVATGGLTVGARTTISMQGTTDHPGLLVDLHSE
ncbi:MAG TPA: endonuclease/exonuclease/phosphatase family protein [Jatrophihabitans sp.]|jgi:hypothetical protein|uniref:endonuclease/exonuclease/phosphatase family protein n=1 Tax=Jatrophihabitans sp. TaxID=1932789 RepID=UPI002F106F92